MAPNARPDTAADGAPGDTGGAPDRREEGRDSALTHDVPTAAPEAGAEKRQPNLTAKTLGGVKWTYTTTAVLAVLQLGYQAIMGRLLEPEVFGLMAMALLAMRFTKMFADMGLTQALIQKPELTEEDVRAAFGSTLLLGTTVYGIVWLLAPLAAPLFNEPDVVDVLRVSALALIVISFSSVAYSLMRRELRFKEAALREIGGYVVGYVVVGLALAALGYGIWALVWAMITGHLVGGILTYAVIRHPLRPLFSWRHMQPLFGFGGRVSVISFLEWLGTNLDTVAVGRYAGTALLGQYSKAYFVINYPLNQLTRGFSNVLFPSFSRIQTHTARIRRAYLSAVTLAAFFLLPVCAGVAVAAQELVLVVLGDQWDTAAQILPILCAAIAINVMTHFAGILCEARAELNSKLALQFAYLGVLCGLLFLARGQGLWAYAAALAVGEAVRQVLYANLLRRIIDLPVTELARHYLPGLVAAGVVAGAVYASRTALAAAGMPLIVLLVADIAVAALALLLVLRLGPTRRVRVELAQRLGKAGVIDAGSRKAWVLRLAVGRVPGTGTQ